MNDSLLAAALALAADGFAVFPCHTVTAAGACSCGKPKCADVAKHPATPHGLKDASTDAAVIRAAWGASDYNVAIATGAESGTVVIDIDLRGADLEAARALFPPTRAARTGSGGLHLYYRHPGGAKVPNSTKKIAPGCDVRGDGGYVIAPPSRHASGDAYAWEDASVPMADVPEELLATMRRRGPRSSPPATPPAPLPARAPAASDTRPRRYALAALDGAARDLQSEPKGARHTAAYAKAHKVGGYVGAGLLAEHEAEARLLHATRAGGWDAEREANTLKAIRDGLREGATKPLAVPDAPPRSAAPTSTSAAVEAEERAAIQGESPTLSPDAAALLRDVQSIPVLSLKRDKRTGESKGTYANVCAVVRHIYGGCPTNPARRLSFNEMTLNPVVDGEPQREGHDLSALRERIELDHGFAPSAENVKAAVIHVAHEQSFHPVRAYLDGLPAWDGVSRVDALAQMVLKINLEEQPLAAVFLQKWLISAVARAFVPGCQVDTALVLFGHQGLKKSGFFRVIGSPWFRNTKMDIANKDAYLQLHSAWIYEWGEIDAITSMRHAGEVKGFITCQEDTFRAPYAAAVASHKRSGVIVGSTNKEKFLTDPTGSRRFWIIDLDHLDPLAGQRIDLAALALMRDQVWAEAVHLLRSYQAHETAGIEAEENPFKWWLTPQEDAARELAAERHAVEDDPWLEVVERWLAKKPNRQPQKFPQDQIHISDIFDSMKLEPAQRKHLDALRMGAVLRRLGYERKKTRTHYGERLNVWMWLHERHAQPTVTPLEVELAAVHHLVPHS